MLHRKLTQFGLLFFISLGGTTALAEEDPLSLIGSLKGEPVPLPDLSGIVRNEQAAIELGKALFFEVNAGSDAYACATCHFAAGADNRITNQLSPGLNDHRGLLGPFGGISEFGGGETDGSDSNIGLTASGQPGESNLTLTPGDFPLHQLADVNDRNSNITDTTNH